MSDYVTQKQLEKTLDRYQATILEAVNTGFKKNEERFDKIETAIQQLTTTLDTFLKRLTDFEDEFTILKAEVSQMKSAFKEKLNVDISVQGK